MKRNRNKDQCIEDIYQCLDTIGSISIEAMDKMEDKDNHLYRHLYKINQEAHTAKHAINTYL